MKACTDDKIITKQVIINYVKEYKTHLLPITADEKVINELQKALDDYERLQVQQEKKDKLLELYKELNYSIIDDYAFLNEDQRDMLQQIGEIKDGLK